MNPASRSILDELIQEYRIQISRMDSIQAIVGEEIDQDRPVGYWNYNSADLENELYSRIPQMEAGQDIVPDRHWPGADNRLISRFKGLIKKLVMRLALPLIRRSLEKQGNLNLLSKETQFLQFLSVRQINQRMQKLEEENRELRSRLDLIEAAQTATEPVHHD